MEIPLNPFVVSSTVKAAPFFGRQDIVVWLITELENSDPHSVLLYGPRGIGKTALLHHLQTVLASEDRYVPVYYGLVERPLDALLEDFAQQILAQTNLELPLPESTNDFRTQFLPQVQEALGTSRCLVVLLDDMEQVSADHAFWPMVASVTAESSFAFVLSTNQWPSRLPVKLKNVVKEMAAQELGVLDEAAAMDMLHQGNERLDFTEEGMAQALLWSGRHPYLIQLLGQYLWETAAEPTVISQDDVETAIPLLVEASASEFEPLWDDLDIAEQLYVAILAPAWMSALRISGAGSGSCSSPAAPRTASAPARGSDARASSPPPVKLRARTTAAENRTTSTISFSKLPIVQKQKRVRSGVRARRSARTRPRSLPGMNLEPLGRSTWTAGEDRSARRAPGTA
jgi:hypothetical protein